MPQRVGLRNSDPARRKSDKQKSSKHCYFRSYETLHHARVAIQKLQDEIDALKASSSPSPDTLQVQATTTQDEADSQKSIPPQIMLKIIGLELSQGEIRLKLEQNQRHLSSMGVLPLELFESILIYAHYRCCIPRLTLALVCRTWHLVVTNTPRLWSDISVVTPYKCGISTPVRWLKKRIELSKGAVLDVTLSASCSPLAGTRSALHEVESTKINAKVVKKLHKLLFATGTERWRSLTILDGERGFDVGVDISTIVPPPIINQLDVPFDTGFQAWISTKLQGATFGRLSVLDMRHYVHDPLGDSYTGLYAPLRNTASNLEACFLNAGQREIGFLVDSERSFQKLSELRAGESMFRFNRRGIPATVRSLSVPHVDLPRVNFSKITDLTLGTFSGGGTIDFPALTSLSVLSLSLAIFTQLTAPNLQFLAIGTKKPPPDYAQDLSRAYDSEDTTTAIIAHFRCSSYTATILPTTLHLRKYLPVEAIGCILERWHQLRNVSLFQCQLEWELRELEGILKARDNVNGETGPNAQVTWKACPELEMLHLERKDDANDGLEISDDEEGNYGYQSMARAVKFSRRWSPLWKITWGFGGQGE